MTIKRITGVDVGGTFTDFAHWDGQGFTTGKLPTSPNQADAIAAGLSSGVDQVLHGTTVATNALLERKGATTMLVTTPGFEDVIEIGRQDRPSLYDGDIDRAVSIVPSTHRLGWVDEATLVDTVRTLNPESVAVSLLESYARPAEELTIGEILNRTFPDLAVSLSHQVNGEFREFERTSTTALNAYLRPVVAHYLQNLGSVIEADLLVMQSSGGLTTPVGAAVLAASILLSGPAGGAIAAAACGSAHNWDRVIAFDMGGTSTDVCRIEGGVPSVDSLRTIEGLACRMPSVAVHTIGAGGGSIGWIDAGGALRVGPASAGAWPGPASYRRGGIEPTVTDANLILGRLGADSALAGDTFLDWELASKALVKVGEPLGLSREEVAAGMIEVVNTHMQGAVRRVTIEQGADPRSAALIAFGGAGGLHATQVARGLGMPAVLVPPHAGVFSALGLLLSPPRFDLVRTVQLRADLADLDQVASALIDEAIREMEATFGSPPSMVTVSVDARYRGQSHETNVPYRPGSGPNQLRSDFVEAHRVRNGFALRDTEIEVVTIRVATTDRPTLTWDLLTFQPESGDARLGERQVSEDSVATRWWRPRLAAGQSVTGPALIEEPEATTWVDSGENVVVLSDGTLEITW